MRFSLHNLQLLDAGNAVQVWEEASPVLRERVGQADFIKGIANARTAMAGMGERKWTSITRVEYAAGATPDVPAGSYVNVAYLATTPAGKLVSELISLRLDIDRRWRLVGYVPEIRR